jgi:predicted GNAT family acetyltransferase
VAAQTRDGRTIEVVDRPERHRFEVRVGGELVGRANYRDEPGMVVFTHTEVNPELQGQGVASELARQALDLVRSSGREIVAVCPFITDYLSKHP